ncbi:anticodon binding domain protein, partial [Chlamydia psittaci 06-1683]
LVQSKR